MTGKIPKWMFVAPLAVGIVVAIIVYAVSGRPERPGPREIHDRKPVHEAPSEEVLANSDIPGIVDELSDYLKSGGAPARPEGRRLFDKVRGLKGRPLYEIELAFLDRSLIKQVRAELLRILAESKDPKAHKFVIDTLLDAGEDQFVRHAAVRLVAAFKTAAAFDSLLSVHTHEPQFPGRYRVVLAMSETEDPRAIDVLFSTLGPSSELSERAHAAQGLGKFIKEGKVRDRLRNVVKNEDNINVRINALGSLNAYDGTEVDDLLNELIGNPDTPDRLRGVAEQFLSMRKKSQP